MTHPGGGSGGTGPGGPGGTGPGRPITDLITQETTRVFRVLGQIAKRLLDRPRRRAS